MDKNIESCSVKEYLETIEKSPTNTYVTCLSLDEGLCQVLEKGTLEECFSKMEKTLEAGLPENTNGLWIQSVESFAEDVDEVITKQ